MPLFVPKTLLQAAQNGAPTKRYREFVIAYFEGEGAIAVPNDVWQPAASWANARTPSGNRMRDRGLLLQRLDVMVTRRGTTVCAGVGGLVPVARLRNAMKAAGLDLKEWNFPADAVLDAALDPTGAAEEEQEAEPAEEAPQGPGILTRINAQCVRSNLGYEVVLIDQYTAVYSEGPLRLAIRGVPGIIGGHSVFQVRGEAALAGTQPEGAARARLLANLKAALAELGQELKL
jgi:hypothetical protein